MGIYRKGTGKLIFTISAGRNGRKYCHQGSWLKQVLK
jgi:hypothetical protein